MTIARHDITSGTAPRMSRCVVNGDMVYLAGLTAADRSADIKGQTQQILDAIDGYLAKAGTDKSKLIAATIWLADMRDFAAMNEVYGSYFPAGGIPPVRSTVEVANIPLGARVEIDFIAAR